MEPASGICRQGREMDGIDSALGLDVHVAEALAGKAVTPLSSPAEGRPTASTVHDDVHVPAPTSKKNSVETMAK